MPYKPTINMSGVDLEEMKESVYNLFIESSERLGHNHPLPPKLLDYFLKELGITIGFSVDVEVRKILGSHAVELRTNSSNDGHSSDTSPPERCHGKTFSLVPRMFNNVTKIPPGPFKRTFAAHLGLFIPVRDFKDNLDSIKEGDQQYLWDVYDRATGLATLAHKNLRHAVSEFTWEADFRAQLFSTMRDDPRISMDKRALYFENQNPVTSETLVEMKTPDMTLGLATVFEKEFRSYSAEKDEDQTFADRIMSTVLDEDLYRDGWNDEATAVLIKERLKIQMNHPKCGLVVDPRWGEVDLVFPWGVYEAKKSTKSTQDAEKQMFLAASVYLSMVDKLARKPTQHDGYQDGTSPHFQIFGFISCAQWVKVYVIYDFYGEVFGESIWEGNMSEGTDAFELVFIFDQIKNYAVTTHRDFIIKHLQPWILHAESAPELAKDDIDAEDASVGGFDNTTPRPDMNTALEF